MDEMARSPVLARELPPQTLPTLSPRLKIRIDHRGNLARRPGPPRGSIPRRLPANSPFQELIPVALPPGRAKMANKTNSDRVFRRTPNTIGITHVAAFAATPQRLQTDNDNHIEPDVFGCNFGERSLAISAQRNSIATFPPSASRFPQPLRKLGFDPRRNSWSGDWLAEKSDRRHLRLLRPRRERPCRRRAAEQRDELAPSHSITSSARASSVGGTSRPSVFAV